MTFFEPETSVKGAAKRMALNDRVKQDVGLIAAARDPFSPADNRMANVISMIADKNVMNNDSSTLDAFYNSTVGQIGIMSARAKSDYQNESDGFKRVQYPIGRC